MRSYSSSFNSIVLPQVCDVCLSRNGDQIVPDRFALDPPYPYDILCPLCVDSLLGALSSISLAGLRYREIYGKFPNQCTKRDPIKCFHECARISSWKGSKFESRMIHSVSPISVHLVMFELSSSWLLSGKCTSHDCWFSLILDRRECVRVVVWCLFVLRRTSIGFL